MNLTLNYSFFQNMNMFINCLTLQISLFICQFDLVNMGTESREQILADFMVIPFSKFSRLKSALLSTRNVRVWRTSTNAFKFSISIDGICWYDGQ